MKRGLLLAFTPTIFICAAYLLGYVELAGILILAVIPFGVTTAVALVQASRHAPEIVALRERAIASVIYAILLVLVGVIAVNRLAALHVSGDAIGFIVVLILAILPVPSTYWLYIWWTGRF